MLATLPERRTNRTDFPVGSLLPANLGPAERRSATRLRTAVPARLTPLGGADLVGCLTQNLSAGGLFVTTPADRPLHVGQRVEVLLEENPNGAAWSACAGQSHYATVVRTQGHPDARGNFVGAGLRFDHDVFFDHARLSLAAAPVYATV